MVFEGDGALLAAARSKALSRGRGDELELVGIAVYGAKNAVDKAFKGAAMHR